MSRSGGTAERRRQRTKAELAELAAQASAEADRLRALLAATADQLHMLDGEGRYVYASPGAVQALGIGAESLIGRSLLDLDLDPALAVALDSKRKAVMATGQIHHHQVVKGAGGRRRELDYRLYPIQDARGSPAGVAISVHDITPGTAGRDALGRAYALLSQLVANTPLGVIEWGPGQRVRRWSPQAEAIFGWSEAEALGKQLDELDLIHPKDRRRTALENRNLIEGDRRHNVVEQRNLTKDRRIRWCRWHNSIVRTGDGDGVTVLALIEDVTAPRAAQERIRHLAEHDVLTGLPNRAVFLDRLRQALARARRQRRQGALLLVDLDHFKGVNDTLGHERGDRLLVETAERLSAAVRETDTVARLGGDEFALILPELEGADSADLVARKVLEALARPIRLEGDELHGAASLGIALFPDDGDNPQDLLRHADLALYRAKATGGRTAAFYTPSLNRRVQARNTLVQELHQAVAEGSFELRYQPQIALDSGRTTGVEALVRWRHPERGLLAPAAFLAVAQSSGLIREIGRTVLRGACRQAQSWRQAGLALPRIALNLSAAECREPDLSEHVLGILTSVGLPLDLLEFEVTERVMADAHQSGVAGGLAGLEAAGIPLALDAFGSDWASLKTLQRLPLGRVKLAPALIGDSLADPAAAIIVEAVIGLGHRLGLKVLACGVESPAQCEALRQLGCDEAQGYLFAPPLTAEEVIAFTAGR